jgi:hypothetical protein
VFFLARINPEVARMPPRRTVTLALALPLLLAIPAASAAARAPLPDRLTVVRVTALRNPSIPYRQDLGVPATVDHLYRLLLSLPVGKMRGVYNCPADFGVSLDLRFVAGRTVVMRARVDPSGCPTVRYRTTGGTRTRSLMTPAGHAFLKALYAALHLRRDEVLRGSPNLPGP